MCTTVVPRQTPPPRLRLRLFALAAASTKYNRETCAAPTLTLLHCQRAELILILIKNKVIFLYVKAEAEPEARFMEGSAHSNTIFTPMLLHSSLIFLSLPSPLSSFLTSLPFLSTARYEMVVFCQSNLKG